MSKKNFGLPVTLLCLLLAATAMGQNDAWQKLMTTGNSQAEQSNTNEAEKTYREALIIAEKFGDKDPRLAGTLIKLATVFEAQAKHEEASTHTTRALFVLDRATNSYKSLKPESSSEKDYYKTETTISILEDAAGIYSAQQKNVEAEPLLKTVLTLRERGARKKPAKSNDDFMGFLVQAMTGSQDKLIKAYEQLATLYFAQGKKSDAETLYRHALKFLEENVGKEQSSLARIHNRLGELAFKQNKYDEAEASFVKALTMYETIYQKSGKPGPDVAVALGNLAMLYLKQEKNYDQAQSYFRQALSIFQKADWKAQPQVADALENYSLLLKKTGDETQAAEMAKRAQEIRSKRVAAKRN
jgi:tetratricopeptide (TPR) repeat protein